MYLWSLFWRVVFLGTSEHQIGFIKCIRQKGRVSKWKCMWDRRTPSHWKFSRTMFHIWTETIVISELGKYQSLELALHLIKFLNRTIILSKLKRSAGHCVINICLCSISHFIPKRQTGVRQLYCTGHCVISVQHGPFLKVTVKLILSQSLLSFNSRFIDSRNTLTSFSTGKYSFTRFRMFQDDGNTCIFEKSRFPTTHWQPREYP